MLFMTRVSSGHAAVVSCFSPLPRWRPNAAAISISSSPACRARRQRPACRRMSSPTPSPAWPRIKRCWRSIAVSAARSTRRSSSMWPPASAPGGSSRGKQRLQRHAALLSRDRAAVRRAEGIVGRDLGARNGFRLGDMGKLPVVRVLATMAHDCRRTELFQRELLSALKILPARRLVAE